MKIVYVIEPEDIMCSLTEAGDLVLSLDKQTALHFTSEALQRLLTQITELSHEQEEESTPSEPTLPASTLGAADGFDQRPRNTGRQIELYPAVGRTGS